MKRLQLSTLRHRTRTYSYKPSVGEFSWLTVFLTDSFSYFEVAPACGIHHQPPELQKLDT
jgi:hypothetical protein